MDKTVIELFAGVGGFRVGLNKINGFDCNGHAIENGNFTFVWTNQWEPSTKKQHAFDCYKFRFNGDEKSCSNEDISKIDKEAIPDHTLLCGGFPCQDYSVAHSLSKEKGIEGKKGVLWWQINDIIKVKKPSFVLLENVDRLIKSTTKQRGRDFGIMMRCLNDNGYVVEWRVINAAEYGHPQRRRRIFIFASKNTTVYANRLINQNVEAVMLESGLFAKKFPVDQTELKVTSINLYEGYADLVDLSNRFVGDFKNTGLMINGVIYTSKTTSILDNQVPLLNILQRNVGNSYDLNDLKINKFKELRGKKKIPRIAPDGSKYFYSEGSMSEFDSNNLPGRTMLTSEGTVNRSTHIVKDLNTNNLRILTPIECERLNQFPDNWTNTMPERKRYFMMGNALVCGLITKIGDEINLIIDNENKKKNH